MARYGLTVEQYDDMLVAQGGVCALCGKPPKKRRLHVDHSHITQRVRALTCWRCNQFLIGMHTLVTAKSLVAYLEKYEQ